MLSRVWLINSLPEEEGEGGTKGVGGVRVGGEGVAGEGWCGKLTISEVVANDDVEMAPEVTTGTTITPNETDALAEDIAVLACDDKQFTPGHCNVRQLTYKLV